MKKRPGLWKTTLEFSIMPVLQPRIMPVKQSLITKPHVRPSIYLPNLATYYFYLSLKLESALKDNYFHTQDEAEEKNCSTTITDLMTCNTASKIKNLYEILNSRGGVYVEWYNS